MQVCRGEPDQAPHIDKFDINLLEKKGRCHCSSIVVCLTHSSALKSLISLTDFLNGYSDQSQKDSKIASSAHATSV